MDNELLQILACPYCKEKLFYSESENKLICKSEGIIFTVENNIPNLVCKDIEIDKKD